MNHEYDIDEIVFAGLGIAETTGEAVVRKGKVTAIEYMRPKDGNRSVRFYNVLSVGNLPPEAVFETLNEASEYCFARHEKWLKEQSEKGETPAP